MRHLTPRRPGVSVSARTSRRLYSHPLCCSVPDAATIGIAVGVATACLLTATATSMLAYRSVRGPLLAAAALHRKLFRTRLPSIAPPAGDKIASSEKRWFTRPRGGARNTRAAPYLVRSSKVLPLGGPPLPMPSTSPPDQPNGEPRRPASPRDVPPPRAIWEAHAPAAATAYRATAPHVASGTGMHSLSSRLEFRGLGVGGSSPTLSAANAPTLQQSHAFRGSTPPSPIRLLVSPEGRVMGSALPPSSSTVDTALDSGGSGSGGEAGPADIDVAWRSSTRTGANSIEGSAREGTGPEVSVLEAQARGGGASTSASAARQIPPRFFQFAYGNVVHDTGENAEYASGAVPHVLPATIPETGESCGSSSGGDSGGDRGRAVAPAAESLGGIGRSWAIPLARPVQTSATPLHTDSSGPGTSTPAPTRLETRDLFSAFRASSQSRMQPLPGHLLQQYGAGLREPTLARLEGPSSPAGEDLLFIPRTTGSSAGGLEGGYAAAAGQARWGESGSGLLGLGPGTPPPTAASALSEVAMAMALAATQGAPHLLVQAQRRLLRHDIPMTLAPTPIVGVPGLNTPRTPSPAATKSTSDL